MAQVVRFRRFIPLLLLTDSNLTCRRDICFGVLLRLCRSESTVPSLLRGAHASMGLHRRYCMF